MHLMIVYVLEDFFLILSRKHSIKMSYNVQTHYLDFSVKNNTINSCIKMKTKTSQQHACRHKSNGTVHNLVNLRRCFRVKYH
jgi:hypothetical protein